MIIFSCIRSELISRFSYARKRTYIRHRKMYAGTINPPCSGVFFTRLYKAWRVTKDVLARVQDASLYSRPGKTAPGNIARMKSGKSAGKTTATTKTAMAVVVELSLFGRALVCTLQWCTCEVFILLVVFFWKIFIGKYIFLMKLSNVNTLGMGDFYKYAKMSNNLYYKFIYLFNFINII